MAVTMAPVWTLAIERVAATKGTSAKKNRGLALVALHFVSMAVIGTIFYVVRLR